VVPTAVTDWFLVVHYGETVQGDCDTVARQGRSVSTDSHSTAQPSVASSFDRGLLVGILVGEGHFGGDGRQPQVTLRMHVRHESLFLWIQRTFPGGRLYGPYGHDGRNYYQWMARGPFLRDTILPILVEHLTPEVDEHCFQRVEEMRANYARQLGAG